MTLGGFGSHPCRLVSISYEAIGCCHSNVLCCDSGVTAGVTWFGNFGQNVACEDKLKFSRLLEMVRLDETRQFLAKLPKWLKRAEP